MYIHNLRTGFATNSSSAHGVAVLANSGNVSDRDVWGQEFGWDWFIGKSPEAKAAYLLQQIKSNVLRHFRGISEDYAANIAEFVLSQASGDAFPELRCIPGGHIDHQSVMQFPIVRSWNGGFEQFNGEFVTDFFNYLMLDDVVVLGGNDNSDEDDYKREFDFDHRNVNILPTGTDSPVTARKDEEAGVWVLFNTGSGNKIRLQMTKSDADQVSNYDKAFSPELVDIKITDFCAEGCKFCYMGSTESGKHAETRDIEDIFRKLGDAGVFEVALGGGEPTTHPDFIDILKKCSYHNIVPNFTTRSLKWLDDENIVKAVEKHVGAVGFSVTTAEEVDAVGEAIGGTEMRYGWCRPMATLHYVLGSSTVHEMRKILDRAEFHGLEVLFLGYKECGRGASFSPKKHDNWLQAVREAYKDMPWKVIHIDTLAAQQVQAELDRNPLNNKLYTLHEGKFSCYIDAVTMTLHESSYAEGEGTPFSSDWLEHFAKF